MDTKAACHRQMAGGDIQEFLIAVDNTVSTNWALRPGTVRRIESGHTHPPDMPCD